MRGGFHARAPQGLAAPMTYPYFHNSGNMNPMSTTIRREPWHGHRTRLSESVPVYNLRPRWHLATQAHPARPPGAGANETVNTGKPPCTHELSSSPCCWPLCPRPRRWRKPARSSSRRPPARPRPHARSR